MKYSAIVMGTSSGGMNALKAILPALPVNFSLPVIIVQHIGNSSENYWIEHLNNSCNLRVKEADEKEKIESGNIYIAPPNYHLMVEEDETLSLSIDKQVNYARPSIDVLFESAADVYQQKLIGIILTGSNSDGALGMKKIKTLGGLTIAENPETAHSPYMPSAAIAITEIDYILSLNEIPELLQKLAH